MPYTAATNTIVGMVPVVVGAHVVKGIAGSRRRRATRRRPVTKRRPVARKVTNTKRKRRR